MSDQLATPTPIEDISADVLATPESIFDLLQRERLVSVNVARGIEGADPKYMGHKLKALKDMGDQEIALKRLVLDEDSLHTEKEVAQNIAEISRSISAGAAGNPFARKVTNGTVARPDKVNRPDIKISATTMNASPVKVTYEKFLEENLDQD